MIDYHLSQKLKQIKNSKKWISQPSLQIYYSYQLIPQILSEMGIVILFFSFFICNKNIL